MQYKEFLKSVTYNSNSQVYIWGPFHKSSYERFLLYQFVEPVLNYRSNEFVALTNLCETGLWYLVASLACEVNVILTQKSRPRCLFL